MKGLIVDDEQDVRDIVAMCMQGTAEMVECERGAAVVELARAERPDFILLDVLLRHERGEDVLRALRSDSDTASIPVIFLTGMDDPADVERLRATGAAGLLTKPIDPRTFAADVTTTLAGSQPAPRAERRESTVVLDEEVICSLLELGGDDDPDFVRDLVGDFLKDVPPRLVVIAAAVSSGDHALAGREAHALKSAAGNVGAMSMSRVAAELERQARSGTNLIALTQQLRVEFDAAQRALEARLAHR